MEDTEEEMAPSGGESRAGDIFNTPRASGGDKAVLYVLVIVTILLIAQLSATTMVFMKVSEKAPEQAGDVPSGSFYSVLRDFPETADIDFGTFSFNPETSKLVLRMSNGSLVSTYSFPSVGQTMISPDFGFQLPEIKFWDSLPERYLNDGDSLTISGLAENSDYRIELIWTSTWEVIDAVELSVPVPSLVTPDGSFCGVDVVEISIAVATLCNLGGDKSPYGLRIILEDPAKWGSYLFAGDSDGSDLYFESGTDLVNVTYEDTLDNGEVDLGDKLYLSGLTPGTEYTIRMIWQMTGEMLDMRTFSTPGPQDFPPPVVWFDQSEVISPNEANVTFGAFSFPSPGVPLFKPSIELWDDTGFGSYVFPSGGGQMIQTAGTLNVDIVFVDFDLDGVIDHGDKLVLSGLKSETPYLVLLIWTATGEVMDFEFFFTSGAGGIVPTGMWGTRTVLSNTEVNVEFAMVSPAPMPTQLKIILVRNSTTEGTYIFLTDDDGTLALSAGTNVGTLTYADLADNQIVNVGDMLKLTNLLPNSDYVIKMIWSPTGDQITSATFSTPA